ncbi:MAG: GNAT family N-acetyltransferase [Candidatus Eremiobacteraeota bacterium]|nr:GNAT family N-acetyltransferase [Candidatus Eremiobacteraeota bacterium]
MDKNQLAKYDFRPPHVEEFEAWYPLYESYSRDVGSPVTPHIAQVVWGWIHDTQHPLEAVMALRDGQLVGFTNYRPFPRTLDANEACFLDDLYVAESERGSGLAQSLIANLVRIAHDRGWTHVRWVAEQGNARARKLYDRISEQMDLVTYRINAT